MPQPRKDQIKNVLTRHSRFDFSAVPGSAETLLTEAAVNPWIVSDVAGGSQEDVPASVEGGVEPYTILAADAITVKRQADPVATVVFAGSDTSTAKVVAAINAAVGVTVAFNRAGRLLIQSDVVGEDSVLVLDDSVPGVLTKLGLTAGTYTGANAPVRGVVTRSLDALGGRGFLRTSDGKNVVTDCPAVSSVGTNLLPRWGADVPGGVPVHVRVKYNPVAPSPYSFGYFADMPSDPEAITSGGDLSLLDGTDALTLTFTPGAPFPTIGPFGVSFPTGPALTRDQVLDVINEEFGKAATSSLSPNGNAEIDGLVGQPYSLDPVDDVVDIAMDGGSFVPVSVVALLSTDVPASDVASRINAALGGAIASAVDDGLGNVVVRLRSLTADGRTSSIELRNGTPGVPTLEKLGLAPGKYRGFWVAEGYGASEIRIRGLARGPGSSLTVLAGAATEARLGLTSGTFTGGQYGEQAVGFPLLDPAAPAAPQPVTCLVPEVLEMGEVDPAVESVVEQFDARSAGSNLDPVRSSSGSLPGGDALALMGRSRGVPDAGKPVVANAFGLIDESFLRAVRDDSWRFFKKLVRGDFTPGINSVTAVVTDVLETPGAEGHGGTNVGLFTVDVDRPDLLSSRQFRLRFGKLTSAKVPFSVTEVGIAGAEWLVNGQDAGGDGTAFGNATAAMKLMDLNTDAAGVATSGSRFIPLTSATAAQGDRTLRVMESEEGNNEPVSVFRQVNARWTVTCGDGVSTFGDFNGATALTDCVAYAVANGIHDYHVLLKSGTYTVDNLDLISDSSTGHHVIIEGVIGSAFGVTIDNTAVFGATSAAFVTSGTQINKLGFKNLLFQASNTSTLAFYSDNETVRFDDCTFTNQGVKFDYTADVTASGSSRYGSKTVVMRFCSWQSMAAAIPITVITSAAADSFLFEDCYVMSGEDTPAFRLENGATSGSFNSILFNRCRIDLNVAFVTAGDPDGNSGALELAMFNAGQMYGQSIIWRDCEVTASGSNATSATLLLYLRADPTKFILERLEISGGTWKAGNDTTLLSPFYIGGLVFGTPPNIDIVHIENVDWGFSFIGVLNQGAPSTEVAFPDATGDWAAFVIRSVDKVVMHNVRWLRHAALSDCGDLLVQGTRRWDINGLELSNFDAGTGSLPAYRMKFVGHALELSGEIANIKFRVGSALQLADVGVLQFYPGEGGSPGRPMVVRNAVVENLTHASQIGIYLVGNASNDQNGLHFVDCVVRSMGSHGFYYIISGGAVLRRLKFSRCYIENNGGRGVNIVNTGGTFGDVMFEGCRITGNDGFGVSIQAGTWDVNESGAQFMGNFFDNNNNLKSGVQVDLEGSDAVGCAYGNVSTGAGSTWGSFRVVGGPDNFMGIETGYTYDRDAAGLGVIGSAADTTAVADTRRFASFNNMMHNRMRLG